ncbi:MAG: 30S ribosomal protein S5 [Proteobacteria bacterium]|nr:30S ribosomal protein S5 [Pseudomonadota bacterium]MCH9757777.1 30S ribosomal protein S5 [Pseudomonadota bacterium]
MEKVDNKQELIEKMVAVNRVTKVVKGGRIMRFSAIAVVGDGNGRVGMGTGKGREVPLAVQKAMEEARANMLHIELMGGTLHHKIIGKHGASKILMQPASTGTGVIAGGPVRMLFEAVGIRDVLAKNIGSSNPHNILRAAIKGLQSLNSPVEAAARRGLPLETIQKRHKPIG